MTDKPDIASLVNMLLNQAKTQRQHSDRSVRFKSAYPDDNDHIDAAVLMERAAYELERLSSPVQISDAMVERAKEILLSSDPSNFSHRVRAALTVALNQPTEDHIGYGIK